MLLFLNLGGGELVIIFLFILLFFGADKLPELARGFGRAVREMKDASQQIQSEIETGGSEIKKNMSIDQDFDEITEEIKKETEENKNPSNSKVNIQKPDNVQARS